MHLLHEGLANWRVKGYKWPSYFTNPYNLKYSRFMITESHHIYLLILYFNVLAVCSDLVIQQASIVLPITWTPSPIYLCLEVMGLLIWQSTTLSKHHDPPTATCISLSTYHFFPCLSSCTITSPSSHRPNATSWWRYSVTLTPGQITSINVFFSRHEHVSLSQMLQNTKLCATLRVDCNTEVLENRNKNVLDWYCLSKWL